MTSQQNGASRQQITPKKKTKKIYTEYIATAKYVTLVDTKLETTNERLAGGLQ